MTQPNPEQTKQHKITVLDSWEEILMTHHKSGSFLNNEYNTLAYLKYMPELARKIQYDLFSKRIVITDELPIHGRERINTEWIDADDVDLTAWIQSRRYPCSLARLKTCIEPAARSASFHPVREYLESLTWDQVPRVKTWLTDYMSVPADDYSRAVGVRWLCSAVKRIFEPGCQADYMMVFEGLQGKRKSSALRTLAGDWFTDELTNMSSKDADEQLQGIWILEMSELDSLSKSEAGEAKQFISRRVDRFRGAYKRRSEPHPRQCIFAGTVNLDAYLKDETGARRFWPVKCGDIDLPGLKRDRDQLWAECLHLYQNDHPIYLETDVLEDLARFEQSKRYISDTWHQAVYKIVQHEEEITMDYILLKLGFGRGDSNRSHGARIGKLMRSFGYSSGRDRSKGTVYRKNLEY